MLLDDSAYRKRMGWRVKWISSNGNHFNYDYHVSFKPDEIAQGKINYNYEIRECEIDELSGLSVYSSVSLEAIQT